MSSLHAHEKLLQELVYGYVRRIENRYVIHNIPTEIYDLCSLFVIFWDHFGVHGDGISVSTERWTITKRYGGTNWNNTTYSHSGVSNKMSVTWQFAVRFRSAMMIGIASKDDCTATDVTEHCGGYAYAVSNEGLCLRKEPANAGVNSIARSFDGDFNFVKYYSGDVLSVTLDLRNAKFSMARNSNAAHTYWENIKTDHSVCYKLAISLRDECDSVTLLDFHEHS